MISLLRLAFLFILFAGLRRMVQAVFFGRRTNPSAAPKPKPPEAAGPSSLDSTGPVQEIEEAEYEELD